MTSLSDEAPPRRRRATVPPLVWAILGALLVALFVLLLGGLSPYL